MNGVIEAAYERCAEITARQGPNFSVGFSELPGAERRAVQAAYAFCRVADDLADDPAVGTDPARLLSTWRAELDRVYAGSPEHPVGIALADAITRFPIPVTAFDTLIRGCEQDLDFRAPKDLLDLQHYCDLVATPIGEISLSIFGGMREENRGLARHLSHALQMTNVLRDIREDHERGRRYLPDTWFAEAALDIPPVGQPLSEDETSRARWRVLLRSAVARARSHYVAARALPDRVTPRCRLAVRLMAGVYESVLERISADPLRVLRERIDLTEDEKSALVVRLREEESRREERARA